MEAAYRQASAGKRRTRHSEETRSGDRRRLKQLIVSLCLFLLVFLGRGAFPALSENCRAIVSSDADFSAAFQRLETNIANGESLWSSFGKMAMSVFGGAEKEIQKNVLPTENEQEEQPFEPILLSKTSLHGLEYFRRCGLVCDIPAESVPESPMDQEPEVVTAVAQVYNASGEKLPKNVSYEYYEFGLEETVCPVVGTVSSGFDYRISPVSGEREFHLALDIAAEEGAEIKAFADGVVRYIGESDEFGQYLMIDHENGVATFYAHCSKLLVRKGYEVDCGQTVALVGQTGKATGPHLHFTIEKDNVRLNPAYYVDPA